jgi:hypothetical protein
MRHSPELPGLAFSRGTPRRAAVRALGVAAALTGAFGAGVDPAPARRGGAAKKRRKRRPVRITSEAYVDDERAVAAKVGQITASTAVCPTGAIATGGGYALAGLIGGVPTVALLSVGKLGNGWHVRVIRLAAPANPNDLTIQASVVCASLT